MKKLKVNTDNINSFKIKNEPVETILTYGNTINCFGIFDDYSMDCSGKSLKRFKWLLKQISEYKANVYIICNEKTIGYYELILMWFYGLLNVNIRNVKILNENHKAEILKQFDEL